MFCKTILSVTSGGLCSPITYHDREGELREGYQGIMVTSLVSFATLFVSAPCIQHTMPEGSAEEELAWFSNCRTIQRKRFVLGSAGSVGN